MSLLSEIAAENYLKAIVKYLSDTNSTLITNGEIARLLQVTPGTATAMAKKLEKDGYLTYKSHAGCSLTQKGKRYGLNIVRRHRLIETFLHRTLQMDWKDIHDEAEHIEHAVSDTLIDRIDSYLGYPERDPHGAIIPKKNQTEYIEPDFVLAKGECGTEYRIMRLTGSQPQFSYYEKMQLHLGTIVTILTKNDASGLAEIMVNGKQIPCSILILDHIFVEKLTI
ncbi:MAG: metal-dependent transcriptional regulator [Treponema sp.]